MTETIKKCEDCKHAVPAMGVGDQDWNHAKCHHADSIKKSGERWHLGEEFTDYSYCSTMRCHSACGKAARLFEAREAK